MIDINLKKLLARRHEANLLRELAAVAGQTCAVYDAAGELLYGQDNDGEKMHLAFGGRVHCTVSPPHPAMVALLRCLITREIEKKELIKDTLERYKEITLLYGIAEKITECADIRHDARMVIEEARRAIRSSNASLMLIDQSAKTMEILFASGREFEHKAPIQVGAGIAGHVALTGRPEIFNNVKDDPRYIPGENTAYSLICAPLKSLGEVIGVLNISIDSCHHYEAEDLKLVQTLAAQASAAIHNAQLYEQLQAAYMSTIMALVSAIEAKDPYTCGHSKRVTSYSLGLARKLSLPEEQLKLLEQAAILHDIGKIGTKISILHKPGKLDDEEYLHLQEHPATGMKIIESVDFLRDVRLRVGQHHERYDGKGYPARLAGQDILLEARIMAIADAYDAMTSERPYRKPLPQEVAVAELVKNAGSQFDPELVPLFLEVLEQGVEPLFH